MRKLLSLVMAFVLWAAPSRADEGMWILSLLSNSNMETMQKLGCHLTKEQIYSINNGSLKDAVVIFGGGCTGEIVSSEGLIFTNHHCGYDAIQKLSSVEHNYLKDGFWALSKDQELPVPGLEIRMLQAFEDVTERVVADIPADASPAVRDAIVSEHSQEIAREAGESVEALVEPFFGGNQYFLIKYKVYTDIRMVGTPPESIGKFGHDTDNWHWPRHTGDFSIFRVYAGADNEPADYSADNKPFQPKHHLPVSLKGAHPGDYSMTIGYPGSTERYLSSWGVRQTVECENASRIEPRDIKEKIWMEGMKADPATYIKYSVKYAHSSNYHQNSIGMNKGVKDLDVIKRKQAEEKEFAKWAKGTKYSSVLKDLKKDYKKFFKFAEASGYWQECLFAGPEIFRFSLKVSRLQGDDRVAFIDDFYKDYVPELDQKVSKALFAYYKKRIGKDFHPDFLRKLSKQAAIDAYVDDIFRGSVFASKEKLLAASDATIKADPVFQTARDIISLLYNYADQYEKLDQKLSEDNRLYIAGRMEMHPEVSFYSDANFTCRLSYGKVCGYTAGDKKFDYFTDLEGVMAKEDPTNWEFVVSDKLKNLYNTKDFGPYADADGRMHVCFISDNDITGGNSGSPVINGDGELIGLAFDGNWEAMSGDIIFEPQLQRCICVDIRYVLFVVDKFGGAKNLIDELTINK